MTHGFKTLVGNNNLSWKHLLEIQYYKKNFSTSRWNSTVSCQTAKHEWEHWILPIIYNDQRLTRKQIVKSWSFDSEKLNCKQKVVQSLKNNCKGISWGNLIHGSDCTFTLDNGKMIHEIITRPNCILWIVSWFRNKDSPFFLLLFLVFFDHSKF